VGDKVRALFLFCTDRAMAEGSTAGCSSAGEEGLLGSNGTRLLCRCWVHNWTDRNIWYNVVGIANLSLFVPAVFVVGHSDSATA
jgi:hypothetical protein